MLGDYDERSSGTYTNNAKTHDENTTVAVTSLVDQIIINNIEEEDDENIDQDVIKGAPNNIEYSSGTQPSRQINKSLSQASNIGNNV